MLLARGVFSDNAISKHVGEQHSKHILAIVTHVYTET